MWKEIKKEKTYEINLKQIISDFSKDFIFEIEIPAIKHKLIDSNRAANIIDV